MKIIVKLFFIVIAINLAVTLYGFLFKRKVIPGEIELGWPYIYYRKFELSDNTLNYGWNIRNLLANQTYYVIVAVLIIFVLSKLKKDGRNLILKR